MFKAAGVVGGATLLSRLLGFVRDAAIAWYFGAGLASDAFIAAFRLPNLFRRLFGEGAISAAIVPTLTEVLVRQGRAEANRIAAVALRLTGVILSVATVACVAAAPWLIRIFAPGFELQKYQLTVVLARIMLPYVLLVCMVALSGGILNVYGHFAAPALSPAFLNVGMIGAIFLMAPQLGTPVLALAFGVLIGGCLQFGLQIPPLIKAGVRFWEPCGWFHPALKSAARLLMPVIVGGAVYQINILIGTLLGTLLAEGSVTYLYFADRLVQFPLGVFAAAATTAVLPSLSRQAAAQDHDAFKATLVQALRMIFFATVPAMVGLILLGEPIVGLLFERGEFDALATRLTAGALSYYAVGLWAFATVRILAAGFFALQDTRTPLLAAMASICANLSLGLVLMKPLGHSGLALAASAASILNLVILTGAINSRVGGLDWQRLLPSLLRTILSSALMGLVVWGLAEVVVDGSTQTPGARALGLLVAISAGVGTYLAVCRLLSSQELAVVLAEIRKSLKRS